MAGRTSFLWFRPLAQHISGPQEIKYTLLCVRETVKKIPAERGHQETLSKALAPYTSDLPTTRHARQKESSFFYCNFFSTLFPLIPDNLDQSSFDLFHIPLAWTSVKLET